MALLGAAMIKNRLLKLVPNRLQHKLKKLYFPRIVRDHTEANWPYGRVVHALIDEGDCVVDVGANIGYISRVLSRMVGPEGTVFCFEPVPETFELLVYILEELKIDNVRSFQLAASSHAGDAIMEIPRFSKGVENFYQSRVIDSADSASGNRTVSVAVDTLDNILKDRYEDVSFIKVDVEGHELAALEGAGQLLSASNPALLAEVIGEPDSTDSSAHRVFEFLKMKGYTAYYLEKNYLRTRRRGERKVDYLFLTPKHLSRARAVGIEIL